MAAKLWIKGRPKEQRRTAKNSTKNKHKNRDKSETKGGESMARSTSAVMRSLLFTVFLAAGE
ncbi:hypothetical protein DW655_10880 [Lachnospiraceae bacterium AM23-2LB]|nr:hypothetical protein DW655_10880 [Lachnospiraceae bacterium AM23-2LB]RJW03331.1 hypothetical protein DW887_07520 [Lachnospiraceae bacterium AM40-2BH]